MAAELEQSRRDKLSLLTVNMERVAARVLWAARAGKPEDWRLLGRSVGQVEKELRRLLATAPNEQELQLAADIYLHVPVLEAQVRCAYLYAKAHSLGRPRESQLLGTLSVLAGGEPDGDTAQSA